VADLGDAAPTSCKPLPQVGETIQVVPSEALPDDLDLLPANNNLDVTAHSGRYYLAFRNAPSHFASPDAMLHVLGSKDEVEWKHEASFSLETDLREPRLLSFDGRLFLYFAVLGTNPSAFEPQGMMVAQRQPDGAWSNPEWCYLEGFIPWRARVVNGTPYLIGYVGGAAIYGEQEQQMEVHWLTTADGIQWEPVIPGQPAVLEGAVSETDFSFLDDGSVVAVARNEEGDETGFGSKICRAEADDLGKWECTADPRKYDSPLLFSHEGQTYLIGRRNVTESGRFDLGRADLPAEDRPLRYQLAYWQTPKRCSLWKVDAVSLQVSFVLDLPSCGDTCFPSILNRGSGHFAVYNYSSPLADKGISWLEGQTGPTSILRTELEFACP